MDAQQDWVLSYYIEENGVTTLIFYRKRNTSDASDIAIQVTSIRQIRSDLNKGCRLVPCSSWKFGNVWCL